MEKPTEVIKDETVAEESNEEVNREIDNTCDLVGFAAGFAVVPLAWELTKVFRSYFVLPLVLLVLFLTTRAINNFLRKSRRGK